jgi:hypothetical protein
MTATVAWTDENGDAQHFTLGTGPNGACSLIRNEAGTAATIAVAGTPAPNYSVYVFGFGFWPGQPQKQGGLTETLNATLTAGHNSGNLGAGDSLVAVVATSGGGSCQWSLGSLLTGNGTAVVPAHLASGDEFKNTSTACSETVVAVSFGTPAMGSGPLTDYEYNMLGWTSASWPTLETVFTAGTSGASILLAENIELASAESSAEALSSAGYSPSGACGVNLASEGNPQQCVTAATVAASTALTVDTYNGSGQKWGASPATYSAETDVIQF